MLIEINLSRLSENDFYQDEILTSRTIIDVQKILRQFEKEKINFGSWKIWNIQDLQPTGDFPFVRVYELLNAKGESIHFLISNANEMKIAFFCFSINKVTKEEEYKSKLCKKIKEGIKLNKANEQLYIRHNNQKEYM